MLDLFGFYPKLSLFHSASLTSYESVKSGRLAWPLPIEYFLSWNEFYYTQGIEEAAGGNFFLLVPLISVPLLLTGFKVNFTIYLLLVLVHLDSFKSQVLSQLVVWLVGWKESFFLATNISWEKCISSYLFYKLFVCYWKGKTKISITR